VRWTRILLAVAVIAAAHGATPTPEFFDNFEAHAPDRLPGAPWKEETYKSGAIVRVDAGQAFSGRLALHITTPRGANYRRGYVAIHLHAPLPQLQSGFFGRAMVWLQEIPEPPANGEPVVHWTLLQGEGRSADDRYNSIYRLGLEQRSGTQFMANFETTPPVTTDCRQQSKRRLPVRRWACVEWQFDIASNEMQFWIDGKPITHVVNRAAAAGSCRGNDLGGQWLAPPRFDSLYLGFERYGDSADDQDLWIDDVALARQRVGCPSK
jgi:polysaccharide lyase-like protein